MSLVFEVLLELKDKNPESQCEAVVVSGEYGVGDE